MQPSFRIQITAIFFFVIGAVIIARLFYWQVIMAHQLSLMAASQRDSISELQPVRGNILASDGFPLAINQQGYLVYANPQEIALPPVTVAQMLTPILQPSLDDIKIASDSTKEQIEAMRTEMKQGTENRIVSQLSQKNLIWALLGRRVPENKKKQMDSLNIKGLGYEPESMRAYPEASMAAAVIGFLGRDDKGKDVGYFGLEGFYDMDLSGRIGIVKQEKDAINRPIPIGKFWSQQKRDGRNLQLYLDRSIQYIVEQELADAIKHYGAKSGSVVIMDPKTGGIMAMASLPTFEPSHYVKYDYEQYLNPIVSNTYEPGSTFKVLTMAAGINENLITPTTACDICNQPFKVDQYYIHTWNDKYYQSENMTEVLAHSDNVGMVFVQKKLGREKFLQYLHDFGIGSATGIDLQGEANPSLRDEWKDVDLYTAAFGQGIAVTGIQMLSAVGAIANQGVMMQPHMVDEIIDSSEKIPIPPKAVRRVISPNTAKTLTDMMVAAVDYGDAHWAKPKGYRIAGKTGTAQVAISGHYDSKKTIASFIGFAPADNPAFIMLTILEEPQSSEWGSETAAPLFFDISKKLFVYLGIPPSQ